MADPVTMALVAQGGSAIMGGLAAQGQAKAEQQKAEINSYIGRTRAMQTDVSERQGLNSELGSMRAALAANGQGADVSTFEIMQELRNVRGRERRIEFQNRNQEANDFSRDAASAGRRGKWALAMGLAKAAPSMFDLYQTRTG